MCLRRYRRVEMATTTSPPGRTARYCTKCGHPLDGQQRFCERCGTPVPGLPVARSAAVDGASVAPARTQPTSAEEVMSTQSRPHQATADTLIWERRVPLITNRFVLWDYVRMSALGAALMIGAVGTIGLFAGEGFVLLPWQVYAVTAAVVTTIFLFVCLVVFRNRYWMCFALTPGGVLTESGRLPDAFNKIVVVAGALTLNPTLAGAGLIAGSREDGFLRWSDVARVCYHERERVVSLSSAWRTVARLYCTPENYGTVAAYVRDTLAAEEARRTAPPASPLRRAVPLIVWVALLAVFTIMTRAWEWAAEETELTVLMAVALALPAGLVGRTGWILAIPSLVLALIYQLQLIGVASELNDS
ncbi:MAG: hypothetical protein DCC58_19780, partial [Chloroflexi bacterium]